MPGVKRRHQDHASGPDESSNKRRARYTEADARLAKLYNDLADDVQTVRLEAASQLVKNLSTKSDDRRVRLDNALTRLVQGLCSGRKAARLGFSVALAEILRLSLKLRQDKSDVQHYLRHVTDNIDGLTRPEAKASGQEQRDHLLGRRFALQAVLHSAIFHSSAATKREWSLLSDMIAALAAEKIWLRRDCGLMLYEYLTSTDGSGLGEEFVLQLITSWRSQGLLRTPEGVALWLTISEGYPTMRLPKDVWQIPGPLHPNERASLVRIMQQNALTDDAKDNGGGSGYRQPTPSFAWKVVLLHLCNGKGSDLKAFWTDAVERGMFSSSASVDRKSLGLQIFSMAISITPCRFLDHILTRNILLYILTQRADASKRHLYEASKAPLNQMIARAKAEPETADSLAPALILRGSLAFDQQTKTKTFEGIIGIGRLPALAKVAVALESIMQSPNQEEQAAANLERRQAADILLSLVRLYHDKSAFIGDSGGLSPWIRTSLGTLVANGYDRNYQGAAIPPLSDPSKAIMRTRLMSCLNHILAVDHEVANVAVVHVCTVLASIRNTGSIVLESGTVELLDSAATRMHHLINEVERSKQEVERSAELGLVLLFAISTLQVYNAEPESESVLQDLCTCYDSWQTDGHASMTMLIELLLSFISKPSALFRRLAEQVFSAFTGDLATEGLESMLDILSHKESLSGQHELFDEHDGHSENGVDESEDSSDGNGEMIDVEEASDVELVNGEVNQDASPIESSDQDENDESSDDTSIDSGDGGAGDEEAAFDRKLREALGTAAAGSDSDPDGSDMDDEQMMALEPHLATIFKQRKQSTTKKQEHQDAKANIVNFKNRVLDLLSIYVKHQYANPLALDLILPLVTLVRTTTSQPTGEKAAGVLRQYFDAYVKHKSPPPPPNAAAGAVAVDDVCFSILEQLHLELALGGSKVHANACSRAGLFIARLLVTKDRGHYARLVDTYCSLQKRWYSEGSRSRIPGSVFTEWTSWSISTRTASG